jgi:hypothetical protein
MERERIKLVRSDKICKERGGDVRQLNQPANWRNINIIEEL